MVDFYKILGVSEDATQEEIKKAYQKKAFEHHPDLNPDNAKSAQHKFREVTEAYQVLRDPSQRSRYDMLRRDEFRSAADYESGVPYGQSPFAEGDPDFDRAFDEWWKRMGNQFRDYAEERRDREKMNAERMARAAAWEWEKEEAKLNKVRAERLRQRTEDARHARHAAILRRFWQTHGGVTRVDAGVAVLVIVGVAGMAYSWKLHLAKGRVSQQQQEGEEVGRELGAGIAAAPVAAMAAAAAARAAAAAT